MRENDLPIHPGDCGGGDICFSNPDCTGAQIPAGSARECCVGTDDGFSYGTPGSCRECIGEYTCNYALFVDGETTLWSNGDSLPRSMHAHSRVKNWISLVLCLRKIFKTLIKAQFTSLDASIL